MSLRIEPLTRSHDRKSFRCADEAIDLFLRRKAMQDQELDLGRTSVLVNGSFDETRILGFYSIAMIYIDQEQIPNDRPKIKRKIPAVLFGQLGVDLEHQGKGYGERLLMDAQAKVLDVSALVGVRAMVLDARNERLVSWYSRYGFLRLEKSLRMIKRVETIRLEFA